MRLACTSVVAIQTVQIHFGGRSIMIWWCVGDGTGGKGGIKLFSWVFSMIHSVGGGAIHWSGEVWVGTEIKSCILDVLIGVTGDPVTGFVECRWDSEHKPPPSLSDSKVHVLSTLHMLCFSLSPFMNITVFIAPWVLACSPLPCPPGTDKQDLTSFNMELSSSGISADLSRVSGAPEAVGQGMV